MSRLSRAMKREQKRAAAIAAPVAAPIDVRVPAGGPGAGGASIGGVPVTAVAGEEIQQTVLTHLQRIAVAAGHSVHATIHDERIGYVVPLRVEADGSSHFTAEPVRTPPAPPTPPTPPTPPASPSESPVPAEAVRPPADPPAPSVPSASRPAPPAAQPVPPAPPASLPSDQAPHRDRPTHVLRPLQDPAPEASPTFRLRALPEPVGDGDAVPGTVTPPLGEFGPPPSMDAWPEPADLPAPPPAAASTPTPARVVPDPVLVPDPTPELDSKPTPPRGFDAVAEAVLGDAPPATTADASPFAEQMAQVNEAVKEGRTTEATELAERTVAQASAVLGLEHPEVLGMRELAAYIAYLGGDPERSFAFALDVARTHHRTRDAEAAYGSLHGAATAWRAVRDPALGLALGRDLLALWDELMAEGGPAAEEVEELESARARMDRLTARAAKSTEPPAG